MNISNTVTISIDQLFLIRDHMSKHPHTSRSAQDMETYIDYVDKIKEVTGEYPLYVNVSVSTMSGFIEL